MPRRLLKLLPNRVRRNYRGGGGIDLLRGAAEGRDGDRPEDWIASIVPAVNPGLPPVPGEGYAVCGGGGRRLLIDAIREHPAFYLGEGLFGARGVDLGYLFKILDSAMRLHVQAHPTADFARRRLSSRYGKLECYYVVGARAGARPYIRLGFQRAPDRAEWRRIIESQDISAMDACFQPVPVAEGEVWFVPGGIPHAIGEGVLLLEIMEPTDLVVRCEFEREGVAVPPGARFMGRDLDFCLDVFDYSELSVEEAAYKYRLAPVSLSESAGHTLERLVGRETAGSFEVERLRLRRGGFGIAGGTPRTALVLRGEAELSCAGERVRLGPGESLFVAAAADEIRTDLRGDRPAEVCFVSSVTP